MPFLAIAMALSVLKRVHPVHVFGLPVALAAQLGALTVFRTAGPARIAVARGLTQRSG